MFHHTTYRIQRTAKLKKALATGSDGGRGSDSGSVCSYEKYHRQTDVRDGRITMKWENQELTNKYYNKRKKINDHNEMKYNERF